MAENVRLSSTPTSTSTPELDELLAALEVTHNPKDIWPSISPDGKQVFVGINQIRAEIEGGSAGATSSVP